MVDAVMNITTVELTVDDLTTLDTSYSGPGSIHHRIYFGSAHDHKVYASLTADEIHRVAAAWLKLDEDVHATAVNDPALFDADAYTATGRAPYVKREKTPKVAPDTVAVRTDDRWKYTHSSTRGVVHCGSHRVHLNAGTTEVVTFCGIIGSPLTYAPGEQVHGCARCAAAAKAAL